MSDCDSVQRVLEQAASAPAGASPQLTFALVHAVGCEHCGARDDLGGLVPHDLARRAFPEYAESLIDGSELAALSALARLHVLVCDDCAVEFGALLAERSDASPGPDGDRLDVIFERVTAEFLSETDPLVRRRARDVLQRRSRRLSATDVQLALAPPSPKDYRHIGLAASVSLRQGPMSALARLVRELTPFLRAYEPDLYILEGSFQLVLRCGLLRGYPPARLHCLAPGALGGLTDLGAGLVGGAVVGLDGVFKEHAEEVAAGMDLDWTIDCVVYLIDPLDATSMQPETLALKRECAVTHTPFLDTYTSAVEFFGLLGASASTHSYAGALPDDLREPFGYTGFPHDVLAMIAHDSNKEALLEFARENIAFLSRFAQRIGTATTAALLNGHVPDRIEDAAIKHASELLRVALESAGVDLPWVDAVASGREGGNMQIAEAVAMGMCDSVIVFEEPRPLAEYGITHQLIERNARRSNHPDQLGARGKQMLLHDPRSTAVWAQLWEPLLKDGGPVSLETAYRDAFGVELVIAHAQASDDGRWNAITVEAAWYLLSAIGMARTSDEGLRGHTRVTVACGAAMCDMIDKIHPVATELSLSISEQHRRYQELVEACKSKFEKFAPRIEQLAQRRRLSLAPASDEAALWSMGSVTIAPIVGRLGGVDRVEATTVARRLAKELRCSALELDAMAFPQTSLVPNRELRRHWATTDIAVVTCDDLSPEWFSSGSPVALPQRMIDNLDAKGAIGEIAGIYIDVNGSEVFPDAYARHGMTLSQLRQIVQKGAGSASIMLAGTPPEHDDDKPPRRTATVCAALRAGAVSVLVSDAEFAIAVLREEARYQGEPTTGGSRESDLKHVAR